MSCSPLDYGVKSLCNSFCSKLEKQKEKKRKEEQKRKIACLSFNPGEDDTEENEEEEQDGKYVRNMRTPLFLYHLHVFFIALFFLKTCPSGPRNSLTSE